MFSFWMLQIWLFIKGECTAAIGNGFFVTSERSYLIRHKNRSGSKRCDIYFGCMLAWSPLGIWKHYSSRNWTNSKNSINFMSGHYLISIISQFNAMLLTSVMFKLCSGTTFNIHSCANDGGRQHINFNQLTIVFILPTNFINLLTHR